MPAQSFGESSVLVGCKMAATTSAATTARAASERQYPQNFLQVIIEKCHIEESGHWRQPPPGYPSQEGHYSTTRRVCRKEVIPVPFADSVLVDKPSGRVFVVSLKTVGTVVDADRDLLDRVPDNC